MEETDDTVAVYVAKEKYFTPISCHLVHCFVDWRTSNQCFGSGVQQENRFVILLFVRLSSLLYAHFQLPILLQWTV